MALLKEAPPTRGAATEIAPGLRRIVACNPGPMSYHGTNTWLIDHGDGSLVVDPGPDDPTHLRDILAACRMPIRAIFITHHHHDHYGLAHALRQATGAPIVAFGRFVRHPPDIAMDHGDTAFGLRAWHTPGHASDHLCFQLEDGTMFSGDMVMGWATTVVSPPDGNMAAYFASLHMLMSIDSALYLPGHGPPVASPRSHVSDLLLRRHRREEQILSLLGPAPRTAEDVREQLYKTIDPRLVRAATNSVVAHLEKLAMEGRIGRVEGGWCRP